MQQPTTVGPPRLLVYTQASPHLLHANIVVSYREDGDALVRLGCAWCWWRGAIMGVRRASELAWVRARTLISHSHEGVRFKVKPRMREGRVIVVWEGGWWACSHPWQRPACADKARFGAKWVLLARAQWRRRVWHRACVDIWEGVRVVYGRVSV